MTPVRPAAKGEPAIASYWPPVGKRAETRRYDQSVPALFSLIFS